MKSREFETHIVTRKILKSPQSPLSPKDQSRVVASPLSAHITKMRTQFKGYQNAKNVSEENKRQFPYHSQEPILVKPKIRDILHGGTLDRVFSRAVSYKPTSRLACSDSITLPKQFLTYLEPNQRQMALQLFEQGLLLVQLNSTVSYFHHIQRQERERYKGQALPSDPSKLIPSTFAVNSPDYQLLKNRQKRLFCRVVKFQDQDLDEVHVPAWVLKHLDLQSGQPMCVQMFRNPGQLHFYDAKSVILEPKTFNYTKFVDQIQTQPEQFRIVIQKALQNFKTITLDTQIDVRIQNETVRFQVFQMHPAEQTVCFNGDPENLDISFSISEQLDREIQIHQLSTQQIQMEKNAINQQVKDLNSVIKTQGLNLELLEQMSQEHEDSVKKLKEAQRGRNNSISPQKMPTLNSNLLPTPKSGRAFDRLSDEIIDEEEEQGIKTGFSYEDMQTVHSHLKVVQNDFSAKVNKNGIKQDKKAGMTVGHLLTEGKWTQGGRHKPIIQNDKENFLKSKNLLQTPKEKFEQPEDSNLKCQELSQRENDKSKQIVNTQPADYALLEASIGTNANSSPIANQIYGDRIFQAATYGSDDKETINLKQSIVTASIEHSQLSNDPTRSRLIDGNYIASSIQNQENADMTILVDEQAEDACLDNNANFKDTRSSLIQPFFCSSNSVDFSEPQTALLIKKKSTQIDVEGGENTQMESLLQQTQKGKLKDRNQTITMKMKAIKLPSQFSIDRGSNKFVESDKIILQQNSLRSQNTSNLDLVDEIGMGEDQNQDKNLYNQRKMLHEVKRETLKNKNVHITIKNDANFEQNRISLRPDKVYIQASQGGIRTVTDFQSTNSTNSKQILENYVSRKKSRTSSNFKSNPETGESGEEFINIMRVIDSCHPSQIKMINYKPSPRSKQESQPQSNSSPRSNLVKPTTFDLKYVLDQRHILAKVLHQQQPQNGGKIRNKQNKLKGVILFPQNETFLASGSNRSGSTSGVLSNQQGWTSTHLIQSRPVLKEDTFTWRHKTKMHTLSQKQPQTTLSQNSPKHSPKHLNTHERQSSFQNVLIPQDPYESRRTHRSRKRKTRGRNQTQTYSEMNLNGEHNFRKKAVPKSASGRQPNKSFLLGGQLSKLLQKQNRMMYERQRYAQIQSETNRSELLLANLVNEGDPQILLSELFDSKTNSPEAYTSRKSAKLGNLRRQKMQEVRLQQQLYQENDVPQTNNVQDQNENENVRVPSTVLNYGHKEQFEPGSPSSITTNGFRRGVRGRESQKSSTFQVSKQQLLKLHSPNQVDKKENQTAPQTVFVHYGVKRNQTPNFQEKDSQISQNEILKNRSANSVVALNQLTGSQTYDSQKVVQNQPQNDQIAMLNVNFTNKIFETHKPQQQGLVQNKNKTHGSTNSAHSTNKTDEIYQMQTLKGNDEVLKAINQITQNQNNSVPQDIEANEDRKYVDSHQSVKERVDEDYQDAQNQVVKAQEVKTPAFLPDEQELLDLPLDSAQILNERQMRKLTSERVIQEHRNELRQEIDETKNSLIPKETSPNRNKSAISDKLNNFSTFANTNQPNPIDRFPIQPTQLSVEQIRIRKRLLPQNSRSPSKDKAAADKPSSSDMQESSALTKRKGFLTVLETSNINHSSDKNNSSPHHKIPTLLKEYQLSQPDLESAQSSALNNKVKWKIVKQKLHEPQSALTKPQALASSHESIHTHPVKKKKSNQIAIKNVLSPVAKISKIIPITTSQNGRRAKGLRTLTEATFCQTAFPQSPDSNTPRYDNLMQTKRLRSAAAGRQGKNPKIPKKFKDSFLKAIGYSKIVSDQRFGFNENLASQRLNSSSNVASQQYMENQGTQIDEIFADDALIDSNLQISQGVQASMVTPKKSQNMKTEQTISQALAFMPQPADLVRKVTKKQSSDSTARRATRQASPEFLKRSWDRMAAQKQKVAYPPSIPSRKLQEKLSSSVEDYNRGGRFSLTKNKDLILPNQILVEKTSIKQ